MEKSGTEEMGVLGHIPPADFLGSETHQAKTVLPRINVDVWLLGQDGQPNLTSFLPSYFFFYIISTFIFTSCLLTVFTWYTFHWKANIKDSSLVQQNIVHCGMWMYLPEQNLTTEECNALMNNLYLDEAPSEWLSVATVMLQKVLCSDFFGELKNKLFQGLIPPPPLNVPRRAHRETVAVSWLWLLLSCSSFIWPVVLPKLSHREAAETRFPSVIAEGLCILLC